MTWTNVFHYSGQMLLVIAAAELLLIVLRVREANLRLRVLQSALLLCLLLPLAQPRIAALSAQLQVNADASATGTILRKAERTIPVAAIWATGCAFLVLRLAAGLIVLRRLRLRSQPFTQRGGVPVRLSSGVTSPVAFGVFRPCVLLPEPATILARETLEPMIAHELAHIGRRDWAFVVTEEFVRAALWFHPGVWWLLERIRTARELAVDASVTAATGAEAYTESLLTAAQWRAAAAPSPQQPLTAIAMYRGGSLRRRLQLIQNLQEHQMTRIHRAAAIGVLSFAALGTAALATSALPLFAAQQEQQEIIKPKVIRKAVTPYPPEAKQQRVQGIVVLDVTIGKDGTVLNITVKSGHPLLVPAAVDSVKEWEFEPASKNGEPVEVSTSIDIHFTLSK